MAIRNINDWARAQLTDLGITPSRGAMQIMVGWARAEGGHFKNDAHFNVLNTTQPMPGAGNTGTQGNIKQYRSWQQGIKATTRTLRNGRYGGILRSLEQGNPNEAIAAIGASPWGTGGGLVASTIRSTPSNLPTAPLDLGGSPSGRGGRATGRAGTGGLGTQTRSASFTSRELVSPAVDNSSARAMAVLNFLSPDRGGGKGDLMGFVQAIQGLQDQPATFSTNTTNNVLVGPDGQPVASPAAGGPAGGGAAGPGGGLAAMAARRANVLEHQHLPYQWGGGHQGRTKIHDAVPLDCSGAVSKVLNIDPRVSGQFRTWGKAGDGGNKGVTIYSNADHVLMKINGHFFGTSHSNPQGGAGWIPSSVISPSYLAGFTARHA
jgi:hypothetical protein